MATGHRSNLNPRPRRTHHRLRANPLSSVKNASRPSSSSHRWKCAQFPKEKPWYKFEEWSKKYNNPVITVWIGRNPIVVLNDAWTASDLMDKRANIYSSRPVFQVPGRLMGGAEWDQPLIPYNDR